MASQNVLVFAMMVLKKKWIKTGPARAHARVKITAKTPLLRMVLALVCALVIGLKNQLLDVSVASVKTNVQYVKAAKSRYGQMDYVSVGKEQTVEFHLFVLLDVEENNVTNLIVSLVKDVQETVFVLLIYRVSQDVGAEDVGKVDVAIDFSLLGCGAIRI